MVQTEKGIFQREIWPNFSEIATFRPFFGLSSLKITYGSPVALLVATSNSSQGFVSMSDF